MEKKTIRCPRCHGILEVTNPKDDPVLLITCPNPQCGAKMRVTFATGDTILADRQPHDNQIGHLLFEGERYVLTEGTNTIGRQSKSSTATIQLPTQDLSMSRLHAQIQVHRLKSGRVKAVLTDLRDEEKMQQRPTLIDDQALLPGDAYVLANGDTITIGQTRIKYMR